MMRTVKFRHQRICEFGWNLARRRNYSVVNSIKYKIKMTGPITVAEYMKTVLTSPKSGYYMKKDVFGKEGDFTTSPEISQLFGEILAIWTLVEWEKLGKPTPCQLVELGPGRGTMMQDILRVYSKLGVFPNDGSLSVHLLEVSRPMSQIQSRNLCTIDSVECVESQQDNLGCYQRGVATHSSIPVFWYSDFRFIPKAFSITVAHEFFDALPIHKFQKVGDEWREVLIDITEESSSELRFVISRNPTPASLLFAKDESKRTHFEVSPQAGIIMEEMGARFEEHGGFSLIIDYGHNGDKTDTFRSFKNHRLHDPLSEPGTADLTADVDFSFLKKTAAKTLISLGPTTQNHFLSRNHIDARLKVLLESCRDEETKKRLQSGYDMIMDKDKMGERFKLMAFFPSVLLEFLQKFPVAGFG